MSDNKFLFHALWVEITTRISFQRLHLRSGLEATVATIIYAQFTTIQDPMTKHSAATDFLFVAELLLNRLLRSYTAR